MSTAATTTKLLTPPLNVASSFLHLLQNICSQDLLSGYHEGHDHQNGQCYSPECQRPTVLASETTQNHSANLPWYPIDHWFESFLCLVSRLCTGVCLSLVIAIISFCSCVRLPNTKSPSEFQLPLVVLQIQWLRTSHNLECVSPGAVIQGLNQGWRLQGKLLEEACIFQHSKHGWKLVTA